MMVLYFPALAMLMHNTQKALLLILHPRLSTTLFIDDNAWKTRVFSTLKQLLLEMQLMQPEEIKERNGWKMCCSILCYKIPNGKCKITREEIICILPHVTSKAMICTYNQ